MRMNLPIDLKGKRIVVAGIGGGWDILGTLPFCHDYHEEVVAAINLNTSARGFTYERVAASDAQFAAESAFRTLTGLPTYVVAKEGVLNVRKGYQAVVDEWKPDVLLLVDGGVDSLMRGDEANPGTILEDTISLTAAVGLNVPEKYLACIGFGTEIEEQVCHYQALENIATLASMGAFLGSCSLTPQMRAFQEYRRTCEVIFSDRDVRKSHIHTRVIPAVQGKFGCHGLVVDAALGAVPPKDSFLTPLMGIYWFFDPKKVVMLNKIAEVVKNTATWTDVMMVYRQWMNNHQVVLRKGEPLVF